MEIIDTFSKALKPWIHTIIFVFLNENFGMLQLKLFSRKHPLCLTALPSAHLSSSSRLGQPCFPSPRQGTGTLRRDFGKFSKGCAPGMLPRPQDRAGGDGVSDGMLFPEPSARLPPAPPPSPSLDTDNSTFCWD